MKALERLSACEIEALEAKRYALVSANTRDLIDAGFGEMRGSEIRAMTHPLADTYRLVNDSWQEVITEIKARERYHGSHKPIKRPR